MWDWTVVAAFCEVTQSGPRSVYVIDYCQIVSVAMSHDWCVIVRWSVLYHCQMISVSLSNDWCVTVSHGKIFQRHTSVTQEHVLCKWPHESWPWEGRCEQPKMTDDYSDSETGQELTWKPDKAMEQEETSKCS